MKKTITLLFINSLLSFFACHDDTYRYELPDEIPYKPNYAVCGVTNVMENLDWLKDNTRGIRLVFVKEYLGQDYLMTDEATSSHIITGEYGSISGEIYDCQGNRLGKENEARQVLQESFMRGESGWVCIYNAWFNNQ